MTTLREVIDRHAAAQPDAPFLFAPEPGIELTYAGLRATARSLDAELAARGIRPGEVVSYMLPNGVAAAGARARADRRRLLRGVSREARAVAGPAA
jgi:non-ribosomal peptide synthetase component E (peptide arylation enzyme)